MKSKIALGFFVQITAISLIVLFTNHFIENQTLVSWIIIGIAILVTIPLGFVLFRSINNQNIEYLELADKFSELEYLVSYQQKKAEDKLLDLAEKVSEISNMLGYTSGYLDILTNQTEMNVKEITKAFRQVVDGTNLEDESIQQISKQLQAMIVAINGVANGAQEQANAIQETSNITDGVSQLIRDITSSVQVATESSAQAAKAAQEGGKTISETVDSILSIKEKVDESAEKVAEMNSRSEEINVIVEKIKDIAAQTDLLALNAAIEAARAGELGRGFSVVASEVRKLSEYSLEAAQEVSDLIEAIQLSAQAAVKSMALGVSEVEKGVSLANQSGAALTSIIQATEVAVQEAKSVVHLTEQQLEMSSKLGSAIESVSAVVEENAASTEEMTAGSNDISNEMQNISEVSARNRVFANNVEQSIGKIVDLVADETASAQTLAEMASSLQNLITRFSYDADSKSEINRSTSKLITPTIGVILPTMSNLFWQNSVDFVKRGAAELGINLLIRDSKDNPDLMQEYILEMVSGKVDGFLLVPYWGLARKALELAREKNIPVMLLDSYQSGLQPQSDEFPNYIGFIGPADETGAYEMGKQLMETISRNVKHKRVIVALDGPQEAASAIIRHKGLARALKEFPEVNLIASEIADYELIKAEERTYQLLNDHPEISGIWAANDMMAQGAIKAAKKIGRKPGHDLYVVGMDLDEVSIQAVRSGEQLFDIGGHWLQFGFGLSILFDHINGYSLSKGRSIIKLKLLPLTIDKVSQFEKDYPNGLPTYDFRDKSRAYNPKAPISFFEMDYSNS